MDASIPLSDEQLVYRVKHDPEAFGELFDQYYPAILGYITKRTANVAVAEDLTAEVFIKALKALPKYEWRGIPIKAWLYAIGNNELRMYYRKYKYQASLEELEEAASFEPLSDINVEQELIDAQTKLERHESFLTASRLQRQLPIKYQEVITLRYGENMSLKEIAQTLSKKEGTVKSLLSRGLKLLRKQLTAKDMQPLSASRIMVSGGQKD